MKYIIFFILNIYILLPCDSFALSDKLYEQYIKRNDFKSADIEMTKSWNHLKSILNDDDFKLLLNNQRKWIKNGREKEVQYLKFSQPFYDQCRMYAISSYARALFLGNIADFLQKNPDYSQRDINNFISNLDYFQLLNYVAQQFEPNATQNNNGIGGSEYVHCSYINDTSIGEIVGFASDLIGMFTGGTKGFIAELAGEMFSNAEKHKFLCKFNPKVRKYSVAYFYSGNVLNERFRKKETKTLSQKDMINGVTFSTTTGKSNLDYITIRADADENGEIIKNLYVYGIDRVNNALIPVNTNEFINNIVEQYEER